MDNRCGSVRVSLGWIKSICVWGAVMKYEIIKGSEKDFDGESDDTLTVYRIIGSANTYSSQYPSDKFAIGVDVIAERRPITEPVVNQQLTTEWDGCGVPSVGLKVMTRSGEGIIDYVGVGVIVYTNNDGQWSVRCDSLDYALSAIRSPENVARDEAISEMLMVEGGMPDSYQPHELVAALYDAGYRKME